LNFPGWGAPIQKSRPDFFFGFQKIFFKNYFFFQKIFFNLIFISKKKISKKKVCRHQKFLTKKNLNLSFQFGFSFSKNNFQKKKFQKNIFKKIFQKKKLIFKMEHPPTKIFFFVPRQPKFFFRKKKIFAATKILSGRELLAEFEFSRLGCANSKVTARFFFWISKNFF
jgi:hypothetical protein